MAITWLAPNGFWNVMLTTMRNSNSIIIQWTKRDESYMQISSEKKRASSIKALWKQKEGFVISLAQLGGRIKVRREIQRGILARKSAVAVENCKTKEKRQKLPRLWFVLKVGTSFHLLDPCGGMKNKSMGCLGGNCMGLCFVLRIRQVLDVVFVAQVFF